MELGETVTVTATLAAAGVAWAEPLTGGWVVESATEATFTVTSEMSADPCAAGVAVGAGGDAVDVCRWCR